jgi:fused signal recognition particle receptor
MAFNWLRKKNKYNEDDLNKTEDKGRERSGELTDDDLCKQQEGAKEETPDAPSNCAPPEHKTPEHKTEDKEDSQDDDSDGNLHEQKKENGEDSLPATKKGFAWFKRKDKIIDHADVSEEDEQKDSPKNEMTDDNLPTEDRTEQPRTADSDADSANNSFRLKADQPEKTPATAPCESEDYPEKQEPAPKKTGFFQRLKNSLTGTRNKLSNDIDLLFEGKTKIDDDLLEELEDILISSDIGVDTTIELIKRISAKSEKVSDTGKLKEILRAEISEFMRPEAAQAEMKINKPHVIMVIGVNGVGKTTTIGKLAAKFSRSGKKVLIGAADTFRAAAVEQLSIWADRAGADIIKHKENSDPAAVAYDSVDAALARDVDIVLVDTAGRLHTKVNLMEELKKIKRSIAKRLPAAPHEVLLILDATTGQNGLSQAELFKEAIDVNGIALTKLDGTAKGGIVVSICRKLNIKLKYIGIGENIEDLQEFDPKKFARALF